MPRVCAPGAGRRNANATGNMQGNYFGTAPYLISPCMGLAAYGAVGCCNETIPMDHPYGQSLWTVPMDNPSCSCKLTRVGRRR